VGGNYSITAEAMEILLAYDWPGNVRELENCVQHMVAINSGPLLHVADLPSSLRNFLTQRKSQYLMAAASAPSAQLSADADLSSADSDAPSAPQSFGGLPTVIPLMELERRAIMNALDYTKGDRAVAAHLLGIGRTTLYRKLKEYQLAV
jgi:DNA-binding NtrC family response regulator